MAFPAVQDADTQHADVSAVTSWSLTYPTNLVSGDLILAFVGTTAARTATWPGGWVKATEVSNTRTIMVAKKVSDGTETGTFTVTMSGSSTGGWRVLRITGWEGTIGTTFDNTSNSGAVCYATTTGTSTTPSGPSLDPNNWASEDTLWYANCASNLLTASFPSNYTDGAIDGGNSTQGTARRELNASSEDPGNFSGANVAWAAGTVAIRPAAAIVGDVPSDRRYRRIRILQRMV